MNKNEATAILDRVANGRSVPRMQYDQALEVLRQHAQPRSNSRKFSLPCIPAKEREYTNAILAFNLGKAIGSRV